MRTARTILFAAAPLLTLAAAQPLLHLEPAVLQLPAPPIVVGHSFGGLVAQRLLGRGLARGCVVIAPAQFKGILALPLAQLQSAWPILSRPWPRARTWSHTPESFHRSFANGVPREESDEIYHSYTIPAPAKPLFQAAVANLIPHSEAAVDTRRERGPLLLVAGGIDRTVPEATVRAAYRIQQRNPGVTELETFPGRGHSLPVDSGWREIADTALDFMARTGSTATAPDRRDVP